MHRCAVSIAVNVSQSCDALRACILGTFSHTSRCPIACVLRTWLLDGSARRQTAGVAVLRRGFVDDERTAQMCEDGWLNLSVIPKEIHKPTAIQQNGGGLWAIISPRLSGDAESPCRRPPRCRGHGEICPYRASRSYRCPRSGSCPARSRRQE